MTSEPELPGEQSLEGWDPAADGAVDLVDVVEKAFAYRGNVTIETTDGRTIVGYMFDRNARVPTPFIRYLDEQGEGPFSLRYTEIANVRFTGTDTAKGNSYADYQRRKSQGEPAPDAAPGATSTAG